jgi:methionine-rich copper-binding protein CopC
VRRTWLVTVLLAFSLVVVAALGLIFNFVPEPFQTPRVVRIEPSDTASEILLTSPVTITFSAPMNQAATETSVQLQPRIDGSFSWSDNRTLVFIPQAALPVSTTLSINISTDARSRIFRPLAQSVQSSFTTLSRPWVISSSPAATAQFVHVPNRVTITFNRALDSQMLAGALTISPPIENLREEWNAQTLTIVGFFQPRKHYQIQIPASVADAEYGIPLGQALSWSFTTGEQYPNFSVLHLERTETFLANTSFTLPVQFTNVSRLDVSLYPISQSEYGTNAAAPFETWYAFQPTSAPLKTWSTTTNATLDKYMQMNLAFDALDAGTYYLKITSPEGTSDEKLWLIQ